MKDYLQKAINDGRAFDASANPEKIKKIVVGRLGFMAEVDENFDEQIDKVCKVFIKSGVCYFDDIEMTLTNYVMRNASIYIKKLFKIHNPLNKSNHTCIMGNSGKCIICDKHSS